MRIAIDSGGTFTDCVFVRNGQVQIIKVASRPDAPAEAIADAVKLAIDQSSDTETQLDLLCGTTVGTNALLERRGGKVALVTTAGFEDVLEIGRQARPKLYDLFVEKSEPLIPSQRRFGANERLAFDGSIVQKLSNAEMNRILRQIKKGNPDSVAICFLFSFRNARHEKQIAAKLRKAGYEVSVSHEILPEFREYERTSTTVINAYLAPVMSNYLRDTTVRIAALSERNTQQRAKTKAAAKQIPRVRIMQSNGGIISAQQAAREPVRTILSGPAGGVIGAAHAAELADIEKSISFDMGGTSTDVALLSGALHSTSEAIVAGYPVAVPMLEIHTVGAGGGSIARFDAGGALRVGPESAGAVPGPICYGRGTAPTVTDAHAVLGHLGNAGLLGGAFALDVPRARALMQKQIAATRGTFHSVESFAAGIIAVANAVMEKAIRVISVERGHDARDYTLIAFGGAGGLHACDLADALEMRTVLIPVFPGGLSALGILRADVVKEFSQTVLLPAESLSGSELSPHESQRGLFGKVVSAQDISRHSRGLGSKAGTRPKTVMSAEDVSAPDNSRRSLDLGDESGAHNKTVTPTEAAGLFLRSRNASTGRAVEEPLFDVSRKPRGIQPQLQSILKPLLNEAVRVLESEGFNGSDMRFQQTLDMRYVGQAYELNVPAHGDVIAAFHRAHELRYGYHNEDKKVEVVNVRCRATGLTEKPPTSKLAARKRSDSPLRPQQTEIVFDGRPQKAKFYQRDALRAGDRLSGPALVLEYSATTLVPQGWTARVDQYGQMLLSRK